MSQRLINGRPEPEVIVNFTDGYAYSKAKMEEALRSILLDKHHHKPAKETYSVKKEDVDLIVRELEIPRAQAEKVLSENSGDLQKTLLALVMPH